MHLHVNGSLSAVAPAWRGETLLMVLREHLGLTGAKFGCGAGVCGACTVLVDGQARRACVTMADQVAGARIVTVEALARHGQLAPLQTAWEALRVAQCGFCQAGQLMAASALLQQHAHPDDAQIDAAMAGNLCRCGTYARIRAAIHLAARNAPAAHP